MFKSLQGQLYVEGVQDGARPADAVVCGPHVSGYTEESATL